MNLFRCILKKSKHKPLEGRHPWIFSGAVDRIDEACGPGDLVRVYSAEEKFLGTGYFNPASQIAVRMLAFGEAEIGRPFFEKKIGEALRLRKSFIGPETDAYRLVHSEGDFLPGLVADLYGGYIVLQFLTAGMERWRGAVVDIFREAVPVRGIYEKGDAESRLQEGLEKRMGLLAGEEPPELVEIRENGARFRVDVRRGQKTGFFLDQRENRAMAGRLSAGRSVLNCFGYTGGFSVFAALGGARRTVTVDASDQALETAGKNFEANGLAGDHRFVRDDVFDFLRSDDGVYDFIVLDPPAFCKSRSGIEAAARGYKDINLCALKKLSPGGMLFTFSCSSYISPDLFRKIVFGAAKDARRDVRVLRQASQPPDHPVNICHPEGDYLKGLLCGVGGAD